MMTISILKLYVYFRHRQMTVKDGKKTILILLYLIRLRGLFLLFTTDQSTMWLYGQCKQSPYSHLPWTNTAGTIDANDSSLPGLFPWCASPVSHSRCRAALVRGQRIHQQSDQTTSTHPLWPFLTLVLGSFQKNNA